MNVKKLVKPKDYAKVIYHTTKRFGWHKSSYIKGFSKTIDRMNDELRIQQIICRGSEEGHFRPKGFRTVRCTYLKMVILKMNELGYRNRNGGLITLTSIQHILKKLEPSLFVIFGRWAKILLGTMWSKSGETTSSYKSLHRKFISISETEVLCKESGEILLKEDIGWVDPYRKRYRPSFFEKYKFWKKDVCQTNTKTDEQIYFDLINGKVKRPSNPNYDYDLCSILNVGEVGSLSSLYFIPHPH